jgi:hypothetical protein
VNHVLISALLASLCVSCAARSPERNSSHPPEDQPIHCESDGVAHLSDLIQSYVEEARNTYPTARLKWELGLPNGHRFLITTRFWHSENHFEQVFVRVSDIEFGTIYGHIANEPMGPGFKIWDSYEFSESELLDWTIQHPDGTEEGNVVGKFIDRYRGQCPSSR